MPVPVRDLEREPEALHALAHPLRLKLLDLLKVKGSSTASELARLAGESSGATSYHLRQLARHGFVVEDEGRGTRRERWWKADPSQLRVETSGDPTATSLVSQVLGRVVAVAEAYAAADDDSDWNEASFGRLATIRLTPAELAGFRERVFAAVDELQETQTDGGDSAPVTLMLFGVPRLEDDS
jgi:DNA-binding transcriptional ArsR family regulator